MKADTVVRGVFRERPVVEGIYMLFSQHELVYIGQSTDCYVRIHAHRVAGRTFDYALVAPCVASDLRWVESSLIEMLRPPQNRAFGPAGAQAMADRQQMLFNTIMAEALAHPEPAPLGHLASLDAIARSKVLTAAEAAARLGVSRDTFNRMVKEGAVRATRIRRRTMVMSAELDALLLNASTT